MSGEAIRLLTERGGAAYFGEPVTQLEHALQTARFATQAASQPALVVAALLHDVGHLLHGHSETENLLHENVGWRWLLGRFGPAVAEPIRLHVEAKRYLCAVDGSYAAQLSPASIQSLNLQGGPFSAAELRAFEGEPYHVEAVSLRRWDDAAKQPGLLVPGIDHYRVLLESTHLDSIR